MVNLLAGHSRAGIVFDALRRAPFRDRRRTGRPQPRYHSGVIEKLFAGIVLAVCLALMLRMLLGARRRARFDAAARRAWGNSQHFLRSAYHWRSHRREAERTADEAIRRAKGRSGNSDGAGGADGEWEGNVYKPKSFRKPRKLH
jgi:hypothetical protein